MKILNFGSLNIDYVYDVDHVVKKGETISSHQLRTFSGGKGLNQSIAMGRAGIPVYHAGAVGKDGLDLLDLLAQAGVNHDHTQIHENIRTGNAIIQRDKEGDNCIILYGGANQTLTRPQIDRTLDQFGQGDYLVLQNEINQLAYIVDRASQKGMIIVLNPSPMDRKILGLNLNHITYFILNEIEAKELLQIEAEAEIGGEDLARSLVQQFPAGKIVLTLGSAGSLYMDKDQTIKQASYQTQVKDTTGAGDTFTGYFLAGLIRGLAVKECMALAAKAAAISVSRLGAAPAIPYIQEVVAKSF